MQSLCYNKAEIELNPYCFPAEKEEIRQFLLLEWLYSFL